MFDKEIRGAVKGTRIMVKEDGAFTFKTVRMVLERELDDDTAAIVGGGARKALDALRDRGFSRVVLPIDAVHARGVFSGKQQITVEKVRGIKVTCSIGKAKKDEDPPLKIRVEYEFPFDTNAWALIGSEAAQLGVTLTRNQLDLPGTSKGVPAVPAVVTAPAETKANGKKGKTPRAKLGTKSSHGDDRAEAAGEIGDPQDADTPEEAEEIRAQRMREQRAQDEEAWTDGATVS